MINFNQKHEQAPSAMILTSLIVLALAFGFYLWILWNTWAAPKWYPQYVKDSTTTNAEKHVHRLEGEIADLKVQESTALEAVGPRLWSGNAEVVSASILAQLTAQSKKQNVAISSFRPSKPTAINGVTQLPVTLQLTGSYKGIHAVLSSLDAPNSRVVLQSIQLSAGQASKGMLSANVGLTAFINSSPTDDTTVSTSGKPVESVKSKKGGNSK